MKVLVIRTVPGEIAWQRPSYNIQQLGLAAALRRRNVDAAVLCAADDGRLRSHSVPLGGTSVPLHCAPAFTKIRKNALFLGIDPLLRQFDVLLSEEYNELFTWHLAGKYPGKLMGYHGPYFHPFNRNYNRMAKVFDAVFLPRYKRLGTPFLAKSDFARAYLESKGIRRVQTVGVGLDTSFFASGSAPAPSPRPPSNRLELLYVGVLTERRNALFLLDVARELLSRGVAFALTVVGQFESESYKRRFFSLLGSRGLEKVVRHVPRVEQKDLPAVYGAADVFLLPTRYDIFGMVLLEAMHFGKTVLTTPNGGSGMLVENARNGFVLDADSPVAWADRIAQLDRDRSLLSNLGAAAKQTVDGRFTWDALADRFIDAFEAFLAERRK